MTDAMILKLGVCVPSATLSYIKLSTVFKLYQNATLDQLATELEALVEAIVRTAMRAS
jgi:hypothetical protein